LLKENIIVEIKYNNKKEESNILNASFVNKQCIFNLIDLLS